MNSQELKNIFNKALNKYEYDPDNRYYPNSHLIKIDTIDDLDILDIIINEIEEEFYLYINTNKYNL